MLESKNPEDKPNPIIAPQGKDLQPTTSETLSEIFSTQNIHRYLVERWILIPLIFLILIPIGFMISALRYNLLAPFWHQNYTVEVLDFQTGQPIIGANVQLANQTVTTNNSGFANINTNIGAKDIYISASYYKPLHDQVLVPFMYHGYYIYKLVATGTEVPITLVNTIGLAPLNGAIVTAAQSKVLTNKNGQATIVLPSDLTTVPGKESLKGYDSKTINIMVTSNTVNQNLFQIPPSGKIYILSNDAGTLNVDKVNLDGSSKQIVLAGTPSVNSANTQIYPSNDWQYIAVISNRSGNGPELYVINTNGDKLLTVNNTMGQDFKVIGWTDRDTLVYEMSDPNATPWTIGAQQLKSFNPSTNQSVTLQKNQAGGFDPQAFIFQSFETENILPGNQVVYTTTWSGSDSGSLSEHQATVELISADGTGHKILEQINGGQYSSPQTVYNTPSELVISFNNSNGPPVYFDYNNGSIKSTTESNLINLFNSPVTYLISPSGKYAVWYESQSSNNTIYVSNLQKSVNSVVATLPSAFKPIGWFTDNYLLLLKNNSHLYIMTASGVKNEQQLVSIASYP